MHDDKTKKKNLMTMMNYDKRICKKKNPLNEFDGFVLISQSRYLIFFDDSKSHSFEQKRK